MTQKPLNTELPWKLMENGHQIYAEVDCGPSKEWGKTDSFIAECKTNHTPEIIERANAAYIVKSANAYPRLVNMVKYLISETTSKDNYMLRIERAQELLKSLGE